MFTMKTVYMVSLGGLSWLELVALLGRHQVDRVIDVRALGDTTTGRYTRRTLERGLRGMYETWTNLSPFQVFERELVRAELKPLLESADGQRLCFLHTVEQFHLVKLLQEAGWNALQIHADGRVTEAPAATPRRTAGARLCFTNTSV
jgi:hypothetical protein